MNILFLTMFTISDVNASGIYTDLMRKFRDNDHNVYIVTPCQRREGLPTSILESGGIHVLRVKTLNVQKTNVLEKGIGQVSIEYLYKRAIKKYFGNVRFDLILYSTPPITYTNVIEYVKKLNPTARTYLMLKDIFPQNAVDLGMMKKGGLSGILYRYFRMKEKKLYQISDYIGCMSPANVKYIVEHNPDIKREKVEICPNSYDPSSEVVMTKEEIIDVKKKYSLPLDKPIFIYGGNLGKPQGIPFLIDCLKASSHRKDCHFVVVGSGTEYSKLATWHLEAKPHNVSLYKMLQKEEYDKLANACDAGLIFLDYRFTIPNYPSRLLPFLMQKKPVIVATDPVCDMGSIAEANGFGIWCPSNDVNAFTNVLDKVLNSDMKIMGDKGYQFYKKFYTVQHSYDAVMSHLKK